MIETTPLEPTPNQGEWVLVTYTLPFLFKKKKNAEAVGIAKKQKHTTAGIRQWSPT
jgi:hypothetical protein